jgi:hypothetical protein
LAAPLHAESSEESAVLRKEIDLTLNELSAILNFVTFLNVFYCLLVLYAVMIVLYAIIRVKKIKEKKFEDSRMISIKIEK